ncbi:MAG: RNA polymerase sigma factor [Capsulimonadaceae bacterium]
MHDDYELIREYVERQSQQSFSCLMTRHMGLVYQTCLREVGDVDRARDAAQATFLVLARKAPKLRRDTVLPAWLFSVARLTAKNVAREERRHRARVEAVAEAARLATDGAAGWNRIEPLLNDALSVLRESDRGAVLLRYFEGRTNAEAAAELGIREDAFRARVSRALDRMRRHLAAEGVAITAVVLGTVLIDYACGAADAATIPASLSGMPDHVRLHASRSLRSLALSKAAAIGVCAVAISIVAGEAMLVAKNTPVAQNAAPAGWTGPILRYNAVDLTRAAGLTPKFCIGISINNLGHVVGSDVNGGYLWADGVTTRLGNLEPSVINDNDEIGGTVPSTNSVNSLRQPALWRKGRTTRLPLPQGSFTGHVHYINGTGVAIGTVAFRSATATQAAFDEPHQEVSLHAVIWKDGRVIDLAPLLPSATDQVPYGLDEKGDALIHCSRTFYLIPANGGPASRIGGYYNSGVAVSPAGKLLIQPFTEPTGKFAQGVNGVTYAFNHRGDMVQGVAHNRFNPQWNIYLYKDGTPFAVSMSDHHVWETLSAIPAAINDQDCFVATAFYSDGDHVLYCTPSN